MEASSPWSPLLSECGRFMSYCFPYLAALNSIFCFSWAMVLAMSWVETQRSTWESQREKWGRWRVHILGAFSLQWLMLFHTNKMTHGEDTGMKNQGADVQRCPTGARGGWWLQFCLLPNAFHSSSDSLLCLPNSQDSLHSLLYKVCYKNVFIMLA